jgi:hypothetical protein
MDLFRSLRTTRVVGASASEAPSLPADQMSPEASKFQLSDIYSTNNNGQGDSAPVIVRPRIGRAPRVLRPHPIFYRDSEMPHHGYACDTLEAQSPVAEHRPPVANPVPNADNHAGDQPSFITLRRSYLFRAVLKVLGVNKKTAHTDLPGGLFRELSILLRTELGSIQTPTTNGESQADQAGHSSEGTRLRNRRELKVAGNVTSVNRKGISGGKR